MKNKYKQFFEILDYKEIKYSIDGESLVIHGDLDLNGDNSVTCLPDKLVVDGDLNLWGCSNLTRIPYNFYVEGHLSLSETSISSIPNGMEVGGNLYLLNCAYLRVIPSDLIVGGNLWLHKCNLYIFDPKALKKVNKSIDIFGEYEILHPSVRFICED